MDGEGLSVEVRVTAYDGVTTVRLAGELDTYTVPDVRAAFTRLVVTPGTQVVVDLRDVSFIDSSGLGALIGLHHRLAAAGARLQLLSGGVASRLLELTHLDQVIDVLEQPGTGSLSASAAEPSAPG